MNMKAMDCLEYLIFTAKQNFEIKIQPSELMMLKAFLLDEIKSGGVKL